MVKEVCYHMHLVCVTNDRLGGAEQFCSPTLGGKTYKNLDYYDVFRDAGYHVSLKNTALQSAPNTDRVLGIFSKSNMAKWLDRNVFTDNLLKQNNSPDCLGTDATDQPGLKEMTLKAIDVLHARNSNDSKGWFLMSEAASIDKQMHALDYDRALGELLKLDDTIKHSFTHLKDLGVLNETLVIVTADHGHGFDVLGNVDTQYLNDQTDPRKKRKAVGIMRSLVCRSTSILGS
jgi:alkaline phosphatase